jgi:ribonucleoside-diphosphate reductase beta chain
MSRDIFGISASTCATYLHFITDRRAGQLGLRPLFEEPDNPFP